VYVRFKESPGVIARRDNSGPIVKTPLPLAADIPLQTEVFMVVQGDQKVSVHLMITIQKVTSNVQIVSRQSPDIY
jgi:hypothetical protein